MVKKKLWNWFVWFHELFLFFFWTGLFQIFWTTVAHCSSSVKNDITSLLLIGKQKYISSQPKWNMLKKDFIFFVRTGHILSKKKCCIWNSPTMVNFAMHVRLDNTAAKFLQCKCRSNVICMHSELKLQKKVEFRAAEIFSILFYSGPQKDAL